MQLKCFLSIDCGLTKVKVSLFNELGTILSEQQADTPLENLMVRTNELKNIVIDLIKQIIQESNVLPPNIKTISTSGHGNGIYLIGENGVLEYGYSSMFTDSIPFTPSTDDVFDMTNQTSWSGQPLPILSYLKNEKPELFKKITKVCFCKDIIKYFLTQNISTDYTDASAAGLLNYRTADYDINLLKCYSLEDDIGIFPEIKTSVDVVGNVSEEIAKETGLSVETKVLGGMFDVNACMLGSGVVASDKYCIIGGTWGINSAVVEKSISNKLITQCCNFILPTRYMCIDSAPTSCSNLEWFLKNILNNTNYKTSDNIVENQCVDDNLFYLPYIYGVSDIENNGAFVGLNSKHTYKDMLRSVYEGIVFEHNRRIEKLKNMGIEYDTAVLTGGAANSRFFCQLFADVTGLNIQTVKQSQTGSLGGAIIGMVAEGVYNSIESAMDNVVKYKHCYYPNKNELYDLKYEKFKSYLISKNN